MITIGDYETTKIIDNEIEDKFNLNKELIMENVGFKLFESIDKSHETYLIICGFGNNGGDGYVLARMLLSYGKDVIIFKIENEKYSNECLLNMNRCKKLKIPIIKDVKELDFYISKIDVVIDAIFGTGIDRKPNIYISNIISKINYYKYMYNYIVYSIDMPSGLNNQGDVYNNCIEADITLSIITYKKAFLNYNSLKYTGDIKVIDNIIINNQEIKKYSNIYLITKDDIKNMEIKRELDSNKSDYGKIYFACGSQKYLGAGILALKASIKTGSGYSYILSDNNNFIYNVPEAIVVKDTSELENADVIALGSGMEFSDQIMEIYEKFKSKKTFILDAGALNNKLNFINSKNTLITPHIVEFSRISGISVDNIKSDPINTILEFSQKHNINILLKGKNTYITDGINVYIINTGNPYMANAGMGDVLTGMIASISGQGYNLIDASIIGAYLHGYIADKLKTEKYIINPTDILENISKYMNELFK